MVILCWHDLSPRYELVLHPPRLITASMLVIYHICRKCSCIIAFAATPHFQSRIEAKHRGARWIWVGQAASKRRGARQAQFPSGPRYHFLPFSPSLTSTYSPRRVQLPLWIGDHVVATNQRPHLNRRQPSERPIHFTPLFLI